MVLALLKFCDNKTGENAWPTVSTLSRRTGLCERSVRYALKAGVEAGVLIEGRRGGGQGSSAKGTTYHLTSLNSGIELPELTETHSGSVVPQSKNSGANSGTNSGTNSGSVVPTTEPPSHRATTTSRPTSFLTRELAVLGIEEEAVEAFCDHLRRDRGVKNPTAWLNQVHVAGDLPDVVADYLEPVTEPASTGTGGVGNFHRDADRERLRLIGEQAGADATAVEGIAARLLAYTSAGGPLMFEEAEQMVRDLPTAQSYEDKRSQIEEETS